MTSKTRKTILQCEFCGTVFKRAIRDPFMEIRCPKCREYDVTVIGMEPVKGREP